LAHFPYMPLVETDQLWSHSKELGKLSRTSGGRSWSGT